MHQETLLYMWHRLPFEQKRRPAGYAPRDRRRDAAPSEWVDVPGGRATLGVDRGAIPFGWDNEFPRLRVDVPAFSIDGTTSPTPRSSNSSTPAATATAVVARRGLGWVSRTASSTRCSGSGTTARWYWRGMFELMPLPLSWPVYVSQAEAAAYARWRGARLPTEAEFQRAAFGRRDGERAVIHGATRRRRRAWRVRLLELGS